MKYEIYIFSFNRGSFLQHCLKSLEVCAQTLPVTIIDDESDDPETIQILKSISKKYRVINQEASSVDDRGGLYSNMNFAIEDAIRKNVERVIFLQDDMQMVRKVTTWDYEVIDKYFLSNENSFQISTNFIRYLSADGFFEKNTLDEGQCSYVRKKEFEGGKSNFSDTGIFDVSRVVDMFGSFCAGEGKSSEKARSKNLVCGRSVYPFTNWLPYPISYRNKTRDLKGYVFDKISGAGFHPIQIMSDEEADRFLARPPEELPIMENFLISPSAPRKDIWATGGSEYNFLANGGVAAKIFSAARRGKHILTRRQR